MVCQFFLTDLDYYIKEKLQIKQNCRLFKTGGRCIDFLRYRYTTLRRGIFLKIRRKAKRIYKKIMSVFIMHTV